MYVHMAKNVRRVFGRKKQKDVTKITGGEKDDDENGLKGFWLVYEQ